MARDLISQNEAKEMLAAAAKSVADVDPADNFESDEVVHEDADGVAVDGDDSNWSPETSRPSKKRLRPSPAAQEPIKSPSR